MPASSIEAAERYLAEGNIVKAQIALLSSIAVDTLETLELARRNEQYILQTMKEMGHDRGNSTL